MLQGRGLDYESMGMAMGYARDVRLIKAQATGTIEECNRQICIGNAALRGRTAQVHALVAALEKACPGHPLVAETGRIFRDGTAEVGIRRVYYEAHDEKARREGVPLCERALTREEYAVRAEAEVLRTPVEIRGWFFSRWYWRGEQHRTKAGAERARAAEAAQARAEVLAA
ncbi:MULTISPECIES: hypothetical protein [Methylobacteriaceae]|uniref:hypothetical protein n=1 Tax=Methylobacteriaceae TaxID=119045 RepID=UPI000CDB096E|nr:MULTISPECIES: hypothetical protein [Methylobacteriaceae]MCP1549445.1 hypothetical protein [Methylorubrum zatmanii]MCP1553942.1 hypothetical protein [Methylorubrum extorquens]MCP1579747.1 hypothetical protein [Methylorubrum extorquens]POR40999.1 hypothetical protein CRT23_21140 [Methylobacterium sp. V23]